MVWNFFNKGDKENMFEMEKMGKKIAQLRKNKNMTQSEFADELGISFQAVSNWERGNTMPDIAKLKDIANIFNVSLDELFDNNNNKILKEVAKGNEVKIENEVDKKDFLEAASYLKPTEIDRIANFKESIKNSNIAEKFDDEIEKHMGDLENSIDHKEDILEPEDKQEEVKTNMNSDDSETENYNNGSFTIEDIIKLAPFMNSESLSEIVKSIKNKKININEKHILSLAPFIDSDDLKDIFEEYVQGNHVDFNMAVALAPFLDEEDLGVILKNMSISDYDVAAKKLTALAPFMDTEDLEAVIRKISEKSDEKIKINKLAPFVSSEFLAEYIKNNKDAEFNIKNLAPFLESEDLVEILKNNIKKDGFIDKKILTSIAMFLDPDDIDMLIKEEFKKK